MKIVNESFLFLLALVSMKSIAVVLAFSQTPSFFFSPNRCCCCSERSVAIVSSCSSNKKHNAAFCSVCLMSSSLPDDDMEFDKEDDDDDDEDEMESGKMRISEIKAELTMRGVSFVDCFDKESLAQKLRDARSQGKADPKVIDQFNKQKLENTFKEEKLEISDDVVQQAVGGDGTLPGGMSPDTLKKLMDNPELMILLQNPKMQDVMKLMMTEGQPAVEEAMENDPEVREIVTKLNKALQKAM